MPDILLYGIIYNSTAERFIRSIDENGGDGIVVRVNTDGGEVDAGWGMVAKFKEYEGEKLVKVDGSAYSMGAMFAVYADKVECLDVSRFLFHRASYGEYFEKSEYMTEERWNNLNAMNKSLRAAIEAKIDVAKFEKLKGVTLDEIFSNDTRINVFLSAKEAKSIGLVQKITPITPAKRAEISAYFEGQIAAYLPESEDVEEITAENQIPYKKMTLEEIKSKHPEAYAQIVAVGEAQERDRVGAWMAYVDADAEAVTKGIVEGKPLTMTAQAEFGRKLLSKGLVKQVEEDSAKPTATGAEATTGAEASTTATGDEAEKATALAAFEAEFDKLQKA